MIASVQPFHNPIVVALDVDSDDEALRLAQELHDLAGGFKVGPRLNLKYGAKLISRLADIAPIFVDNKHFDIPSTMRAAIQTSFDSGASLVTIHGTCGAEALAEMAKLEAELTRIRSFRILAVTVLTSWTQDSLPRNWKDEPVGEHVLSLAEMALNAGLRGVVCSPHEVALFRSQNFKYHQEAFLVTPGIRFPEEGLQDQKRVMEPGEAIQAGANLIIVGRPILKAESPREVLMDYLADMYQPYQGTDY